MIARRDQIEKVACQLTNLRFLDQCLFHETDDRDSALVRDLKALPRVERRAARCCRPLSLGLRFRPGRFSMILAHGLADSGRRELVEIKMTRNPIFHPPIIVLGTRRRR